MCLSQQRSEKQAGQKCSLRGRFALHLLVVASVACSLDQEAAAEA